MKEGKKCDECNEKRIIGTDGLCHECRVRLQDEGAVVDDNGEVWVPGGFRL